MIKMLNAITDQIDDPNAAVAEILEQLDPERNLLKNSIGLVACNYEFIDMGTFEALEEALPFEIAGVTTLGNAAKGLCGQDYLSISVITSDDVSFSSAITGDLTLENLEQEMSGAFERAKETLGSPPVFILAYPPLMPNLEAASFFRIIKRVCADTPVFGTFSCDQTLNFQESKVLYNGKAYRESMVLILMEGNVHPRFFVTSIPERNIQKQHAIITESEGVMLKQVNHMPVMDYLGSLGLAKDGTVEVTSSVPLMVNYNDGTKPVAMAIYEITAEGYARCAGDVPVDATLAIGMLDYESIMETAETMVSRFLDNKDIQGVLMYPCLSRNMLLGVNGSDEMKKIIGLLGDRVPYQICYAGGEICPTENAEGKLVNHIHNFSFVACVL
jgi:hypothetical protein